MNISSTGDSFPIETIGEPRSGLGIPLGSAATTSTNNLNNPIDSYFSPLYLCDDLISATKLASPEGLGVSSTLMDLGVGPFASRMLSRTLNGLLADESLTSLLPFVIKSLV
jgi:hypothetical protein